MTGFRRIWLRRLFTALTAVAFAATSQGLSGLELVAHVSGWVDLSHQTQVHFEAAGDSGHSDRCQLGLAAMAAGPPAVSSAGLRFGPAVPRVFAVAPQLVANPVFLSSVLPRAPPA